MQQLLDEGRFDAQFLAASLAGCRPALQQSCKAITFLDERGEEAIMAGQAQCIVERLEGFLWLKQAVQRHRQKNVQLQFATVMLPVSRLFDRGAQRLDRCGAFTLGNA
ncbi:hypothetical protein D3C77_697380 [compost metagenome]